MQTGNEAKSSRQRYRAFLKSVRDKSAVTPGKDATGAEKPQKSVRGYFREYVGWLWPFRFAILAAFLLGMVSALLSLVLPQATMHIIDQVLPDRDLGSLHWIGLLLMVVIIVQQGVDLTRNWTMVKTNARIIWRLREKLYEHLLGLPLHKLSNMKTGGIVSRLSGDITVRMIR